MSDATLHATEPNPDDFAVQIADQIESFLVAVTEVAKGDEPGSTVPFLLLEVSQLLLAGVKRGDTAGQDEPGDVATLDGEPERG